jgi:hypothetical protein
MGWPRARARHGMARNGQFGPEIGLEGLFVIPIYLIISNIRE